jgi:hypothetical protein
VAPSGLDSSSDARLCYGIRSVGCGSLYAILRRIQLLKAQLLQVGVRNKTSQVSFYDEWSCFELGNGGARGRTLIFFFGTSGDFDVIQLVRTTN